PDVPGAVVAVKVPTRGGRHSSTAVDVTAGHGAPLVVAVHLDRHHELPRPERRARVARSSFVDVPAVVRERRDLSLRPVVDLLPGVLPHVTDVEVAVCAVEREAPRVPETEPDDLPARAATKRIDPQQLAELLAGPLRAVARITSRAAVAQIGR